MKKTLVVMAAGMGSRFGGLKQIEPIGPNGEFIIDYSLFDAKRAGFEKVVFVIKKELEATFKDTIGKRIGNSLEVVYAYQELDNIPESKKYLVEKREKPWGTLHAVYSAKDYVDGNFVVINADDFYGSDSYLKASEFLDNSTKENEYACISYPYQVTASKYGSVKRGVCDIKNGNIINIVESKLTRTGDKVLAEPLVPGKSFKIEVNHPVSMNMFVFKKSFFAFMDEYIEEFFKQDDEVVLNSEIMLPVLVKEKIATGEIALKNIVTSSKWLGITYREDLEELKTSLKELIASGEYPEDIW